LRTDCYGTFRLTDAIRPAPEHFVVPVEGYRRETYRGRAGRGADATPLAIPTLAAAVSAERLFDTFLALLDPLGEVLDVVLETSHTSGGDRHRDLRRWSIDKPVLASYFCEFEDLLLNDGCTGVAVIATDGPMELQFDEHKQLVCYAHDLKPFLAVLREAGVPHVLDLRLISE